MKQSVYIDTQQYNLMLGQGHRWEKETRKKILAEKARQHNERANQLASTGFKDNQVSTIIREEQYQKRHPEQVRNLEPYNISKEVTPLGGSTNLYYKSKNKQMSETKQAYEDMENYMKNKQTQSQQAQMQEKQVQNRIKSRIRHDHIQEDHQVDFGQKMESDYKSNFIQDDKMKELVQQKDMQHHQRKNDLKWYAETYIKNKQSLRK